MTTNARLLNMAAYEELGSETSVCQDQRFVAAFANARIEVSGATVLQGKVQGYQNAVVVFLGGNISELL